MNEFDLKLFVDEAIKEAEKAFEEDEVPVGAVLVKDGKIIAKAHNLSKTNKNRLDHAETLVLNKVIKETKNELLEDYSLIVTLEPCVMCYGACVLSRLKEVIYVVKDDNFGYSKTLQNLNIFSKSLRNLNILKTNYQEEKIIKLMQNFFEKKRK